MSIYFCLSYLSVSHTITLINTKKESRFCIITSNEQLALLFAELYGEDKLVKTPCFSWTPQSLKGLLLIPLKLIIIEKNKAAIRPLLKKQINQDVYFFFNNAAYSHAWMIRQLSKHNTLYYQEDINIESLQPKRSLMTWFSKTFIRYVYREDVLPVGFGDSVILHKMTEAFLLKVKANRLNIDLGHNQLAAWLQEKINLPKGEVLIISNFLPKNENEVFGHIEASDLLIKTLLSKGYSVHFKMHPRAKKKYSFENRLFEVPKHIPANLLLHYNVYIGHYSSTLYEAANQGLFVVSLIDYFPAENKETKIKMKGLLLGNLKNNNTIHFPKSIEEILGLLESV